MFVLAIRTSLNANPKQVREHIMNETAQILACYRKNCANPSSPGQLVLPECMKLLPLYANCVIKNDSISGGSEISTDDRSYLMHLVNSMDPRTTNVFFYPTLLPFVSKFSNHSLIEIKQVCKEAIINKSVCAPIFCCI